MTDIRIRYRIAGVTPWSSDSRYDALLPGGTLADWHYPVFGSAGLDGAAGEHAVEMLLTYSDADGARREEFRTAGLLVLPPGNFELTPLGNAEDWLDSFINLPFLAGYVGGGDRAMQLLAAGLRRKLDLPAALDRDGAEKFLAELYRELQGKYVTCIDPPGFLTTSMDAIARIAQPRETLEIRNETSISLSLLFASVAEAAGLESWLAFNPGACLVGIRMPGRGVRFYDLATLADGGGSVGYALSSAEEKLRSVEPGAAIFVPVRYWQGQGVGSPELSPLSPTTLASWGIELE